jgi:hypothetical protein
MMRPLYGDVDIFQVGPDFVGSGEVRDRVDHDLFQFESMQGARQQLDEFCNSSPIAIAIFIVIVITVPIYRKLPKSR